MGVRFPGGAGTFSLRLHVQTGCVAHPASIQWVSGALSPGVNRLECEADHSPSYNTEVKNAWEHNLIPHTSSWLGI
jgi:hypothetical protein